MGSTTVFTRRLKDMNMRVISVFAVFTVCVLCSAQTEIPEQFATESDGNIETIQDNTEETRTPRSLAVNRDLMRAKEILAKVGHHCTASKNNLAAAKAQIAKHTNAVHKALNVAKKICKKEKEMARRSAEKKKKHEARGATFKFDTGKPCKGGKGNFRMKLKQDQRVVVGKIPANMKDVWVKLRTDKDVDTELWTANGKREIAIVAWRVGKINSPTAASIKYAGGLIKYSGYNGIKSKNGALNFGHEDIQIVGKAKVPFEMRAFAFEAGVAHITYSWGADPAKCKAQKAALRKENRAKHHAKLAMRKKMSESKYKAALMVLQGKIKGCKGAKKWTTTSRNELKKALAMMRGHGTKLKICRNTQESLHKKHVILVKQEKAAKERLKKERSRKEKAAKETKVKEKKSKEARHKELKLKEKSIKEKKTKELKGKEKRKKESVAKLKKKQAKAAAEKKHKEKIKKWKTKVLEKKNKERASKEQKFKRELTGKEKKAKAKERNDKKRKKELKAKGDEKKSTELTAKEKKSKETFLKEKKAKEKKFKEVTAKETKYKESKTKKFRAKEKQSKENQAKEESMKE